MMGYGFTKLLDVSLVDAGHAELAQSGKLLELLEDGLTTLSADLDNTKSM
jgi:hypothetical protein